MTDDPADGWPKRPFTPETLAERWNCTGQHVRNMIRRHGLKAFKIGGKLLRISAAEVERWEKMGEPEEAPHATSGTAEAPAAPPSRQDATAEAIRLSRMSWRRPRG